MDRKIKIIYTNNAKIRVDELREDYVRRLEDELRKAKSVPGTDAIEVTASDVEAVVREMDSGGHEYIYNKLLPYNVTFLLYLIAGIGFLLYGIFKPEISQIYFEDRIRLLSIFMGMMMIFLSLILRRVIEIRRGRLRQREIIERLQCKDDQNH